MTNITKFLDHNAFEPWELMFRNLFDRDSFFLPAINSKPNYPTDIYEDEKSVTIEIAAVGLDKEDLNIEETDGILTVSYDKKHEKHDKPLSNTDNCYCHVVQNGIIRRAFSLSWKFSDRFDLQNIDAQLEKGILKIVIPKQEQQIKKPNNIKIK